jgi:hypothetical protein
VHVVVQVAGSLVILIPFVLVQLKRLQPSAVPYLAANLVGSAVLAVDAALDQQWGFLLLEGVWAGVSGVGLIRTLVARRSHDRADRPAA